MTTRIEQRVFGKLVKTYTIHNKEKSFVLDVFGGRVISVRDKAYAKITSVQKLESSVLELVQSELAYREYPEWDIASEHELCNGETIEIGPKWCHLTIHRES